MTRKYKIDIKQEKITIKKKKLPSGLTVSQFNRLLKERKTFKQLNK